MTNSTNLNVNPFGLAQAVNSGWSESEGAVPCQKEVKKFIEITGTARLHGKSTTEPISIREFVQIVRRDRIDLGPQWDDSDDAFRAALKAMLRQIGVIGEKRKATHSSSSSVEEPEAKKRKSVRDDPLVDTIHAAVSQESVIPVDLCKIIQSYCGNYGEAEIERFIRTEYRQNVKGQTMVFPGAFEKAEAFLKEQNIDRNTITTLDLSGIAWDIDILYESDQELRKRLRERSRKDPEFKEAWAKLIEIKGTSSSILHERSNILLQIVQELAPNVKTIKMTDLVKTTHYEGCTSYSEELIASNDSGYQAQQGYYREDIAKIALITLSKFRELETLELSYKDIVNDTDSSWVGALESDILLLLYSQLAEKTVQIWKAPFPKLKIIRIIGGTLPEEIQAKLKRGRPELVIECLS